MDNLIWKSAAKAIENLPVQYYAYLKQSNPKFFPGNYFTIPETINKGVGFLEDIWTSTKILADSNSNSKEIFASILCLELLSDLENVSKTVLQSLRKLIRMVLKIAPFSFTGIQEILEKDISSGALITWVLMKEKILTKHAAKYLARLVISKIKEDEENKLEPIASVNVMRLMYQVGLPCESTEDFLYESLESKSYLNNENSAACSPDAFHYFLSSTIANCPPAKKRFENLLIQRLEERIGHPADHPLDASMRILAFESLGLLETAKIRNSLCEEFASLKNLQRADGSWVADATPKNSPTWGKGIGITANLLYKEGKVITSAFALKAVHVFYERRKKSLVGNNQLGKSVASHIIA